jgi:SpoVK/Ycf46/Vps4 family AAA+-type ATPase
MLLSMGGCWRFIGMSSVQTKKGESAMLDLTGKMVEHRNFGKGRVSKFDGMYMFVAFDERTKPMQFQYPTVFEEYMKATTPVLMKKIAKDIEKKKIEEEKKKKIEKDKKRAKKKIAPRKSHTINAIQEPELATTERHESEKPAPSQSALEELHDLPGLHGAKKMIEGILALSEYNLKFRKDCERPSLHMIFQGDPGTAKTTVARIFCQILQERGVIGEGKFVEASRPDLIGEYIGQSAPKVCKLFDKADGGVLFIDEAYSLSDGDHHNYGEEALAQIVLEMENRRDRVVVILAGYPVEMQRLYNMNSGLRSRLAEVVDFESYSLDELYQILELMVKKEKFILGDGIREKVLPIFYEASKREQYGEGRFVRKLFEFGQRRLARRIIDLSETGKKVSKKTAITFIADDFQASDVGCGYCDSFVEVETKSRPDPFRTNLSNIVQF